MALPVVRSAGRSKLMTDKTDNDALAGALLTLAATKDMLNERQREAIDTIVACYQAHLEKLNRLHSEMAIARKHARNLADLPMVDTIDNHENPIVICPACGQFVEWPKNTKDIKHADDCAIIAARMFLNPKYRGKV